MRVLEWITSRPSLRAVLVSVFAGITDLAEFARLLATGDRADPEPSRAGGGAPGRARRRRGAAHSGGTPAGDVFVTEDLEEALSARSPTSRKGRGSRRPPLREGVGMGLPLSRNTPVIVQGITGRMGRTHAALMRAYGTNIVGGTSTRTDATEAAGVPVFANCRDAVLATGAVASVAMAPPLETLAAVEEALAAGIRLIVTVAEGIPLHDAIRDRPRGPPRRRDLDRRLHARHGDPRRDQAGLPARRLPAPGPIRDHVEERHAVLRMRLPPRAGRPRPEHLGRRRRRPGEGRALRRPAAGVLRRSAHPRASSWSARSAAARKRNAPTHCSRSACASRSMR